MAVSIRKASRAKKSFDRTVRAFAWYAGWTGFAMLAVVALLWLIPGDSWDGVLALRARSLPMYTLVALLLASLLGWRFINVGEDRIKVRFGNHVNLVLFVILPVGCILAGLFQDRVAAATGTSPPDHPFWQFVRWYPISLISVCAAVFLLWKSRPRKHVYLDRTFMYLVLLLPYGLLFAFLELGLRLDWLDAPMREAFTATGYNALALQLILAYFVGGD